MKDKILEMMKERKKSKNTPRYDRIDKAIRIECREAKEEWLKERCNEIEELEKSHKTKEMYNKVKDLTNKGAKKRGGSCINNEKGETLFDGDEIAERWMEYIKELYGEDRRGEPPQIEKLSGPSILGKEVRHALEAAKNGKATGTDEISTEMLKALGDKSFKRLTDLCNNDIRLRTFP
jgi:hypothetical protein